ncbi:cystathionine beta-lyase [Cryptococcus deuterogattii R265]|uniref:Cystathionine beta-lyase n=1 Tax=Cryptococcus deuterogattii (strain R265) TaxID=294750 RepID=A0A095D858_CRYD2|nr:cystathionine beta-lyase [Cryptococcus deuterogattii R265]KIR75132.1 cystathionine beta-lyase [Cryptococcus deuterogattii CA1014]
MTTPSTPGESSLATSIYSLAPTPIDAHKERVANWRFSTICASVDGKDQYGASSTPIYQTATFKGMDGQYDYTRSGNPTRAALENHLARLYGATQTFALSTGMTCLDTILRLVRPGETVLAGDDLYGGTNRLLTYLGTHGGVDVRHVDTTDVDKVIPHLGPGNKVKMVLLESPTNPLLKIADLQEIADAVHSAAPSALIVVDNTMMSPYLQRPLEIGADIVYDSATKYLSGHHDLMAGIIAASRPAICKDIAFIINSVGSGLAPFDSFLLLRGVKTMSLRMDRQMASAQLVALYLDSFGFLVHYPGLKSHPKRDIHYKQASGAGAVLSFVTGDKALSERIVGGTRLWGISVSFGAVNSLISMPCLMSHASISAAVRAERGLPENLIRLCVGIEDPRDLIDDLEHSLLQAGAVVPNLQYTPLSETKAAELYARDGEAWILERAKGFKRPSTESTAVDKLVRGVKQSLGLSTPPKDYKTINDDIAVSAPGKVILFGEHAVVHGVTAIASSVDLRCFSVLSPRRDRKVGLEVPNIGVELEWEISKLPWNLLPVHSNGERHVADKELDTALLEAVEGAVNAHVEVGKTGVGACVAFLYLYMMIAGEESNALSVTFTASSNLPISAGLGSSAAYSTCVAASFLLARQHLSIPSTDRLSKEDTDLVDGWAFLAEKVLHGNPSGIDNAVAVRGGAVAFTRSVGGKQGGMDGLHGFSSVRLLLTNTFVPRDTKTLVAGVSAKRLAEPQAVNHILDSIQAISDEARSLLGGGKPVERAILVKRLEALIKENHVHLVNLGVSHPSLEMIVAAAAQAPFELATKLTGAGGGGCALTLIPDNFPESSLNELVQTLEGHGFQAHLTTLGGPGLGVLTTPSKLDQTSEQLRDAVRTHNEGEGMVVPKRASLREADKEGLHSWAERLGKWVYA